MKLHEAVIITTGYYMTGVMKPSFRKGFNEYQLSNIKGLKIWRHDFDMTRDFKRYWETIIYETNLSIGYSNDDDE